MKLALGNVNGEKEKEFGEWFAESIQQYTKNNRMTPNAGLNNFFDWLVKAHNVIVQALGLGCLEITVQCPNLDSLESLWEDYCSGHISKVAERFLVTSEIKMKLGLETVTLTTTIKEDDYLACKKSLLENSGTGKSNVLKS